MKKGLSEIFADFHESLVILGPSEGCRVCCSQSLPLLLEYAFELLKGSFKSLPLLCLWSLWLMAVAATVIAHLR